MWNGTKLQSCFLCADTQSRMGIGLEIERCRPGKNNDTLFSGRRGDVDPKGNHNDKLSGPKSSKGKVRRKKMREWNWMRSPRDEGERSCVQMRVDA